MHISPQVHLEIPARAHRFSESEGTTFMTSCSDPYVDPFFWISHPGFSRYPWKSLKYSTNSRPRLAHYRKQSRAVHIAKLDNFTGFTTLPLTRWLWQNCAIRWLPVTRFCNKEGVVCKCCNLMVSGCILHSSTNSRILESIFKHSAKRSRQSLSV